SVIDGKAVVRLAGTQFYDVDARARPISLEEVGRFFPTAGLQGSAAGPFHVTGPLSDLKFSGDFRLPDGGRLGGRGTFDLASKEKGYDLTARLVTFNARTIDSKAP